jgi:Periplasmic copper-binding protein (NosD)
VQTFIRFFLALLLPILAVHPIAAAEPEASAVVNFSSYDPQADGVTDDTPALARCFGDVAKAGGGVVTIPPGNYFLAGGESVLLSSHTSVLARGARFHLPERLGDKARLVIFAGRDIRGFTWEGGEFLGHVFDPASRENTWEPNVSTRIFVLETSPGGTTSDITFRDVRSDGIAGAVVGVEGVRKQGSESEVDTYAERIRVENCTLLRSGKFMWDYGYLWQHLVWADDYEPWEAERAKRYFRNDLVRSGISMADGDDRARFDNRPRPIPVSASGDPKDALCFFGAALPKNLVRGRQYFVVESGEDFIKISDKPGGAPIRFDGGSGEGVQLIANLLNAFSGLYVPIGAAPGKGGMDLQCCRDVNVTRCVLSALGDTMHIQRSRNVIFAGNQIVGSRMGAFFLAEYCQNATITGNLVDGTNGSRVISVEKSCEDVTITGNTFRNGGRGSWINQPKNFILTGNIFVNNTTKCDPDPKRGRRSFLTGQWESYPELYFTTYRPDGHYGPVIVRGNIFVLGESAAPDAVTFAPNGHDLQMTGNVFQGRPATIRVTPGSERVDIRENSGAETRVSQP